jgi:hypothetical protein
MSTKKLRRSLTNSDPVAAGFVYGESEQPPLPPEKAKPSEPPAEPEPKEKSSLMSRLMKSPEKEATVRLTVDLSESMHRKLSILCAKTGRKKAEVVRMLLDEALSEVED